MHVWTRAELIASGWTSRALTAAVRSGRLVRARRDRYLPPDAPRDLVEAVRVGGLLGCLSLLQLLGVFVFGPPALHVHMTRGSSRMRSPESRTKRLAPRGVREPVLHWHTLIDEPTRSCVGIVDALINAVRCQTPRHAVATIDSALNKGLLRLEQLAEVFAALPARYRVLRGFVDGRAQSGPETLVRLMVRSLGCRVEPQVAFPGVGFVDLVVDGWLVIECDSRAHHSDWAQQLTDYRRDLMLARQGFCVLRLTAADIMYEPDSVMAALRGLLQSAS
ncbi:DUF559 domain-containing protein [Microbacterium sp.]|uniref:DUF559 domain-containing protein n=1 Tax=Microbacterium sp. TaxID=51671 RepID=UPI0037CB9C08